MIVLVPKWVQEEEVWAIHDAQIESYGGLSGLRDENCFYLLFIVQSKNLATGKQI
jgi:hypothetical protein